MAVGGGREGLRGALGRWQSLNILCMLIIMLDHRTPHIPLSILCYLLTTIVAVVVVVAVSIAAAAAVYVAAACVLQLAVAIGSNRSQIDTLAWPISRRGYSSNLH